MSDSPVLVSPLPTSPVPQSAFATVEVYRKKAYHPGEPEFLYAAPWKAWYDQSLEATVQLMDLVRTFQLKILLHQFDTEIATFLDLPETPVLPPLKPYERPTNIAYNARIRELAELGMIKEEDFPRIAEDAPVSEQKDLPNNIYITPIPKIDHISLSEEEQANVKKTVAKWYEEWNKSALVLEIRKDLALSDKLQHELASDDGWSMVRDGGDGLKTWYREEKEVATHSFKVNGIVKSPLMQLLKLIYEIALFQEWFPMMRSAKEIHEENRFSKVCQSVVAAIWPFSDRELLLEAKGIDHSQSGRILINLRDLPKENPHWFEASSSHVRCSMIVGGFCLEPFSLNETRLSFYSNVDPQLSLPTSLLNMINGKMIHTIIPTMCEYAPKTEEKGSKWEAEVKKHKATYNDILDKMALFFPDAHLEEQKIQ